MSSAELQSHSLRAMIVKTLATIFKLHTRSGSVLSAFPSSGSSHLRLEINEATDESLNWSTRFNGINKEVHLHVLSIEILVNEALFKGLRSRRQIREKPRLC